MAMYITPSPINYFLSGRRKKTGKKHKTWDGDGEWNGQILSLDARSIVKRLAALPLGVLVINGSIGILKDMDGKEYVQMRRMSRVA